MPTETTRKTKGGLYHCPVCGAEIVLLAPCIGCFEPHCCNRAMEPRPHRVTFYACATCGSEIAVLKAGHGPFTPHCCGKDMRETIA